MAEIETLEPQTMQPSADSAQPASSLKEDLLRPEAFAAMASTVGVALVETHISWVFLLDRDVFKIKKPVELGFLDFESPEKRRRACEEEVRLNRRLAPGVYLGVVPVTRESDGRCVIGGTGAPIDWAVHMTRLSDEDRADQLLAAGTMTGAFVDGIAARMAAFHKEARTDAEVARFGRTSAIARNVVENFDQTRGALARYLGRSEADEIVGWQMRFVDEEARRFEERIAQGRIRDGHGDLRLEHVYRDEHGGIRVLDCIEFNERFRYADVCADIAFLSMDLAAHRRVDLAERLLAAYAREADDYDLYAVVDFYESYRAFVRGKVASMLANDAGASADVRQRASEEARRFFRLALSFDRPPLVPPCLVAVAGVIASGKSSVAARVALEMSAPVLEADRTRKSMLGVDPYRRMDDAAWKGAYDPAFSERVYGEILRRASVVLSSGRPVVLDASFRTAALRRAARDVAVAHGVPFRLVECRAPRDVCLARLAVRERQESVSDGRRAIFDQFCAGYEPVREIDPGEHLAIDTTRPLEENVDALLQQLPAWPHGLTA
jgi:aminoglycoside phosphotransferase family enzyme/predicted kinase